MPLGTFIRSETRPTSIVTSKEYEDLYRELETLPDNTWTGIPVTEKDAKALAVEMNQVRRAVQRWFYEAAHKKIFNYTTNTEKKTETTSVMWVKKIRK